MNSKRVRLIVFLISCFHASITQQPDTFCIEGKAERNDCKDREINKEDFKWNLISSFNERKEVPKFDYVEIDMHRALYIVAAEKITIVFKPVKAEQCKLFMKAKFGSGSTIFDVGEISLSGITFEKDEKTVVAVFEPKCLLYAERNEMQGQMFHIFMRNLPTLDVTSIVLDKTKEAKNKGLGHFINVHAKDIEDEEALPASILEPNLFFPFSDFGKPYLNLNPQKCNHLCQYGRIFRFKLTPHVNFANTFKLNPTCEWMSIYLNGDRLSQSTEISLRHGFVILPTELRAYPMDFENFKNGYEVIMTYYVDAQKSNLIIANRHGKAVHKKNSPHSEDEITFVLSHDNCLTDVIGANVAKVDNIYQAKDFEYNDVLNLGYLVARRIDMGWEGTSYSENPNPDQIDYQKRINDEKFADYGDFEKNNVEKFKEKKVTVTEPPPTVAQGTGGTDPPVAIQAVDNRTKALFDQNMLDEQNARDAAKQALQGMRYMYWAIPAGFATGSFASFLLANIIMFVFKRTVFTFWYKSMYKRYGSDTTMGAGTTMGKTGAGETIGGGTTAGGTTMGGTTAGETGSTTAA